MMKIKAPRVRDNVAKIVTMAIVTFAAITLTKWALIPAVIYLIISAKSFVNLKKGSN